MKIEIWSDYACPFCYIGEKRLEKALAQIDGGDKAEVIFKSFELDPAADREVTNDTVSRFAWKYGLSKEEAAERVEAISRMGRSEGLDFRYASTRYTNTFDALRLTKFAAEKGHSEIVAKLFAAYFTENQELSDFNVLKKIAAECGLAAEETAEMLESGRYGDEVRRDEAEAAERGVHGVPYFLINGRYAFSGAMPTEDLREALEKISAEETAAAEDLNGLACGPDGCKF